MTAKELLLDLESQGVNFSVAGTQLKFVAPSGLIGELTLDAIGENKPEIIDELRKREQFDILQKESIDRLNAACPQDFQLSPGHWAKLDQIEAEYRDAKLSSLSRAFNSSNT